MKKLTTVFAVLMMSPLAHSAVTVDAKVISVGTYGTGRLFVQLDKTINEPGCNYAQFHVETGHSQISTWMSIALAALTSGGLVSVTTDGCLGPYPTMNSALSTHFRIAFD